MYVVISINKQKYLYHDIYRLGNILCCDKLCPINALKLAKKYDNQYHNNNSDFIKIKNNDSLKIEIMINDTIHTTIILNRICELSVVVRKIISDTGRSENIIFLNMEKNDTGISSLIVDQNLDTFYLYGIHISNDDVEKYS